MKIIFLESSAEDIAWMRRYYRTVFPQGSKNAQRHYGLAKNAIKDNPFIGHPSEYSDEAREFHITRTPFSFIYRVKEEHIEVLRVIDKRSD